MVLMCIAKAAGEATKYQPPNIAEFDGAQDGRLPQSRSHGRQAQSSQAPVSPASQAMSLMTAFFEAQAKASVPASTTAAIPHSVTTLSRYPAHPLPLLGDELRRFLQDFFLVKGIDIRDCQSTLDSSAITPDIISHMSVSRLCELTGLLEGHVLKLQVFGKEWSVFLAEGRAATAV